MPPQSADRSTPTIKPASARRIRRAIIRWGKQNYQDFPWRNAKRQWHALIAEVLLQRTRARSVAPVYSQLVSKYLIPDQLAREQLAKIRNLIYPLGLGWRAPLIKALAKELSVRKGKIPRRLDELLELPGIGPYAASAWLSFHGNRRAVIVDANIVRFISRVAGQQANGESRRKKWLKRIADALTPPRAWKVYNYAILDFTMKICTKTPKCNLCPLRDGSCIYGGQNLQRSKL